MGITIQELSKSYGDNIILHNFSLEINDGTRLCICGANGTGKSTILRILSGLITPDSGKVIIPKNCGLGYVEQELSQDNLNMNLLEYVQDSLPDWNLFWHEWEAASSANDSTLLEKLMLRQHELETIYGYNPEHKARTVLSGLGFSDYKLTKPLFELSGGWREKAKLARILTAGADILLLDEPTNHLDLEAVEWLENYLINFQGALVFVAHDRIFMDKVGTHILSLDGRKPLFRKENYSQFLKYQDDLALQKKRETKNLKDEIEHKRAFVDRFKAKASKAKQAASREKMLEKLEKDLKQYEPEIKNKELNFKWPEPSRTEKTVLTLTDVAFQFSDGKKMWPTISFEIYRGQKIALVGPNGCGKSTLLKIIIGKIEQTAGSVKMASMVRLAYFSQHQLEILKSDETVLNEIRRLSDPKTTEVELMSVLGLFLLGQSYFARKVDTLSGGEKNRLILATLFLSRANFLILDEPTNHLDIESRAALISALEKYKGTLLMVAHDRNLLSKVAEQAWALSIEGIKVFENGFNSYDSYRKEKVIADKKANNAEKKANNAENKANNAGKKANNAENKNNNVENKNNSPISRNESKDIKREQAAQRHTIYKQIKPLQKKYEQKEKTLEKLLLEQQSLEISLANPEIYADTSVSTPQIKRFKQVKEDIDIIMEAMSELENEISKYEIVQGNIIE